ncbi:hypothetical protein [Rhizobium ruizarguesonis]|uniref:hypothetical protein n=1 Tax=Rhizobium ruizarguesonis TaxID=2081791 RepID=UPI00102FA1AD|nr:hypothetical protein [Rhizobium ruizarguesonis]TBE09285.1 hypothetical protein ELH12_26175 [Rhizobium ruizarguesonis]TBE80442.1 hypothetical protein ELH01_25975 [Rhizobium ruizarguesonis]TBE90097.1 hypothetical protein ELG99_26160 [Rhizobium ruizarguesonis]
MRISHAASLMLLSIVGQTLGSRGNAIAAETEIETRAARVCAGLGSSATDFQGSLTVDDLSVNGEGNGTVTLSRNGVDLGKIQPGTYQQYNDCLLSVMKLIMPKSDPEFATCSRPEFGLAGYENQETLPGTSGWRGGGYNQNAFCTDFTNSVIGARGLSGNNYKIEVIGASEEQRWTGLRHGEYNYHCNIKLSTGPKYNAKKDPLCGLVK